MVHLLSVSAGVGAGLALLARAWWRRERVTVTSEERPVVLVQVPFAGEVRVLARVLDAVAALDWPALRVQLLDDSPPELHPLVDRIVEGRRVTCLRRGERRGGKAGNLAWGLQHDDAGLVAIFDADHLPAPDFLKRTVPALLVDRRIGFVQGRLDGVNRDASSLTAAQGLAFDVLMAVEQARRSDLGAPLAFNGAAGVWRRAAIEAAGGWEPGFAEDLDLSARAHRAGFRGVHLADVVVGAELSTSMADFVHQQLRWTHGKAAVLRRLGLRSTLAGQALARLVWPLLVGTVGAALAGLIPATGVSVFFLGAAPGLLGLAWAASGSVRRAVAGLLPALALAVALAPRGAWAFGLGFFGVARPHVVAAKGGDAPNSTLVPVPEALSALVYGLGASRAADPLSAALLAAMALASAWVGLGLWRDLRDDRRGMLALGT